MGQEEGRVGGPQARLGEMRPGGNHCRVNRRRSKKAAGPKKPRTAVFACLAVFPVPLTVFRDAAVCLAELTF